MTIRDRQSKRARSAPAPSPPTAAKPMPAPAQLPAVIDGFAGRADELAALTELTASNATTAPVAVIVGTAGIGKTTLATHWAHEHRDQYPDGQLYVNLRGHGPGTPMRSEQALGGFLRALAVPAEQVPLDLDESAALYRTLLADRRILVLLDNAVGVDQVRPLLPAGTGCLALVTSRDRLAGLAVRDGARLLRLDTLGTGESLDLLTGLLGDARPANEPDSAAELARLCGHLPLALRIAAAQLARHPDRPIADLVARLRDGDRLAALEIEGDEQSAVRAAFDLSYVALKPEARRLFRMGGLLPGTDLSAPAAAALIGQPPGAEVTRSLAQLTDAHLLGEPVAGRYLLHDLMRLYAQALTEAEDSSAERTAATLRLYEFYLRTADAAARLLYPQMQRLPLPPAPAQPVSRPPTLPTPPPHSPGWRPSGAISSQPRNGPRLLDRGPSPGSWWTRCAGISGCAVIHPTGSPPAPRRWRPPPRTTMTTGWPPRISASLRRTGSCPTTTPRSTTLVKQRPTHPERAGGRVRPPPPAASPICTATRVDLPTRPNTTAAPGSSSSRPGSSAVRP